VEEGNATAEVERQRKDVVVMERAMQRSPRGILIRSLAVPWLHPRRIHPHLVLNACKCIVLTPARFLNKYTT